MLNDISSILLQWQYDPDDVLVRLIPGDDGRQKIQLRVDLGVLQMEMSGRPDGLRPEGCESWLDYYEHQQGIHDAAAPDAAAFVLGRDECLRLWHEGIQYYHRYLSLWHLNLYELCVRDTARNLRLLSFVQAHAAEERYKLQFDQWRPYIIMMNTRAVATPLIQQRQYAQGLQTIEAGIDAIRDFLEEYQQSDRAEECMELASLERWREEILTSEQEAAAAQPEGVVQILRRKLEAAVAAEEFEEAARLRDEIRKRMTPS